MDVFDSDAAAKTTPLIITGSIQGHVYPTTIANNNVYVIRYSGFSTESTSSSFRASCSLCRFCWCSFGALALCPSKLPCTCSSSSCGNSRRRRHSNNSFRFRPNKLSGLLLELPIPILVGRRLLLQRSRYVA